MTDVMHPVTVAAARQWALQQLTKTPTAAADVRSLLCFVLACSATYLFTYPEAVLSAEQWQRLQHLIERRQQGEPIAYITGQRAFWTFSLAVNDATLIPRPETELLVEEALAYLHARSTGCHVLDLGTGTGAVALAIASEIRDAVITGVDFVPAAVLLAQHNAKQLGLAQVRFIASDWFSALAGQNFDLIVSNPPYVEAESLYLQQGDVRFEPHSALTAGPDGLDDIRHIIAAARQHLSAQGALMIEHGWQQAATVQQLFVQHGYHAIVTKRDLQQHDRVTIGYISPV